MAPPRQPNKTEASAPGSPGVGAGGIIQVTTEDETIINEYAKEWGVPKAEALRRLLEYTKSSPTEPTASPVADKTIKVIEDAQRIGLVSADPNDIINTMGKGILIKSMGRQLNDEDMGKGKGKFQIEDIKEMMYLSLLSKMAGGGGDNNDKTSTVVQDMKSENDKLRQELKDTDAKRVIEMDKLKGDMRDMFFEKKIETLEATNTQITNGLANQLAEISQRMELYRTPPINPTPEQAKDAITHLEDLGKQVSRIKGVFSDLGMIPAVQPLTPSTPGNEPYREKDGSVNTARYAIEKITGAVEKGMEAWEKKKPEFKKLEETPIPKGAGQGERLTIQMTMTPQEYFYLLLGKPELTQDEANYIAQNKHKFLQTPTPPQQYQETPHLEPHPEPTETQKPEPQPGEKKSVEERLKEQEEEEIKRAGL